MADDVTARLRLLVQGILHPAEMDRFASACAPTTVEELAGLREQINRYVAWLGEPAPGRGNLDLDTAAAVAEVLVRLLDDAHRYSADERALLRGAVSYFVDAEDSANDVTDVVGFDDDVRVLNSLLDALGRSELALDPG